MHEVKKAKRTAVLLVSVALMSVVGGAGIASAASSSAVVASYNGGTIDLSQGWGTAAICAVTAKGTSCFGNQSEYQAWFATQPALFADVLPDSSGNCSTGLKLFSKVNYAGTELIIFVQSSWINLSTYSFADELSSYEVGACAVDMAAGANGSGAEYPGNTSPGADVPTLGASWNDRMQSVYII